MDIDALPRDLLAKLSKGKVNLDDPVVTLELLKLNAVIGVIGLFLFPLERCDRSACNGRFVTLRSTTLVRRSVPVRSSRTPARVV
jgi:hypothetical protein